MKKTYKVEVDCANCARKMEEAIVQIAGVKQCTLNFMTLKLKIEMEDTADVEAIMDQVTKTCKKIEPDFVIER